MRAKGDGTIHRRSRDGRYVVAYTAEGRRYWASARTLREAQARLAALKFEVKAGARVRDEHLTVGRYLEEWLAGQAQRTSPHTHAGLASRVRRHIVPTLGDRRLSRLTGREVEGLYRDLAARGLAPGTIHLTAATLRQALGAALRLELVRTNVAAQAAAPRRPPSRGRSLSAAEGERLIARAATDPLGAAYVLALGTGMRAGEVLALRWEDVDLAAGRLTVRTSMTRPPGGPVRAAPKAGKPRGVLLAPFVVAALRRCGGTTAQPDTPVFRSPQGEPLREQTLMRRWHAFCERGGLPRVRFHDLRHSTATLLLERGVHPSIVAMLLGHSSAVLTLQTYSHAAPELAAEAVRALDGLFPVQNEAQGRDA
jgi:integrase